MGSGLDCQLLLEQYLLLHEQLVLPQDLLNNSVLVLCWHAHQVVSSGGRVEHLSAHGLEAVHWATKARLLSKAGDLRRLLRDEGRCLRWNLGL